MMITVKGFYGILSMINIAKKIDNSNFVRLLDISKEENISLSYLEQIFSKLKKAKLVTANRGPNGGYKLLKNSQDISVFDIMNAVDESFKFTRCGNCSHLNQNKKKDEGFNSCRKKCDTHYLWKGIENSISSFMKKISLDLVAHNPEKLEEISKIDFFSNGI